MAGVLLLGNLRSSLPIARSLAGRGLDVHVGAFGQTGYAEWSRFVAGSFWHAPLHTHPVAAVRDIAAWLAQRPSVNAIFGVSEQGARFVARHRDQFGPRVRAVVAAGDLVARCADKAAISALCVEHGVALAAQRIVETPAALRAAIEAIGFPLVIKGVDSRYYVFGRKALILRSPQEFQALESAWPPEPHQSLAVQRYLDGPRHNLHFAAVEGRLVAAVDAKVLRTSEFDGTGYNTACVSVAPDAGRVADLERIVAALTYTGVGCAQIVTSRDGAERSFMELNPRLGANWKIAHLCDAPLAVWAYEIAFGRPPEPRAAPWRYPIGRRLVWTKGDQGAVTRALRGRSVGMGAVSLGAIVERIGLATVDAVRSPHAAFDWDDPLPGLAEQINPIIERLDPRRRERASADEAGQDGRMEAGSALPH